MKKILISASKSISTEYIYSINTVGGIGDEIYLPNYLGFLNMSFLDMCEFLSKKYDGLLLSGGGDVNPLRYGEKLNGSINIDDTRDIIELELIKQFMQLGKPIIGICRGFQVMNVALGGTLNQDNGTEYNKYHTSPDLTFKVHSTYCSPSFLKDIYGEKFNVNSHHHQSLKKVADDLIPIQYSEDKSCIEGVVHKTYPYIGIQWHPERLCKPNEKELNCVDGTPIFKYFLSLCDENK